MKTETTPRPTPKEKNPIISAKGNRLEIDISTPKLPKALLLISAEDWQALQTAGKGAKWSAIPSGGYYNKTTVCGAYIDKRRVLAHRVLVTDCQAVSFKDGNKLNLLRENMVACDLVACRSGEAHADSVSGVKGVSPSRGRYRLDIRYRGATYYIGLFTSVPEASEAKDQLNEYLETADYTEAVDLLKNLN